MLKEELKFKLWTDGISTDYQTISPSIGRFERGKLTLDQIEEVFDYIASELLTVQSDCEPLVVVLVETTVLEFSFVGRMIYASNPKDPNFQNISISIEDIRSFILSFLDGAQQTNTNKDEKNFDWKPSKVRIFFYGLAFLVFVISILSIFRSLTTKTEFLVVPRYKEIENKNLAKSIVTKQAGVYASGTNEGDVVLQIRQEGDFTAYDLIRKGVTDSLHAVPFTDGKIRPVEFEEEFALISDTRFFFYPINPEKLTFLERDFYRLAASTNEIPQISF